MHERLAYRVYRELGLVAPRSAHARLVINGEDWGVFSLVEEVDGRFTDRQFEAGDGNLYKEIWPGVAVSEAVLRDELLSEALKTNEESADHSGFLLFHGELRAASPAELPSVVERYLDGEATLAYLAVDQALVNWDGVTAFYCYDPAVCQNHNYYWYQAEQEPRFTLIPWDLDNTFQSSLLAGVPGLLERPADCSLRYDATGRKLQAPGCDPLLRGLLSRGAASYAAQLERVLAGPFAPGVLEGWIDELQAQLEPQVLTDTRGPDMATFQAAVASLRASLPRLRESAELQLAELRQRGAE
jgi:spore coat protein CotH